MSEISTTNNCGRCWPLIKFCKSSLIKTLCFCLTLFSLDLYSACTNNIIGPKFIFLDAPAFGIPGTGSAVYSINAIGPYIWTLVNASPSSAAFLGQNGGPSIGVDVNTLLQNCTLKLKVSHSSGCDEIDIVILPTIKIIPEIYPYQNYGVHLIDNCNGSPPGCTYTYNWNVSPAYCLTAGSNPAAPSIGITVPSNPSLIPAAVTVNCIIACSLGSPITNQAMEPVTYPVKLHQPIITGSNCFGCPNCPTGNFALSCQNIVGAAYYNWSFGWNSGSVQILSGQGTQNIVLSAGNAGVATLRVQAQTAQTNPNAVSDFSPYFNVNICCVSNLSLSTAVNSPNTEQKQAAIQINASNTINNGATALYHAGNEVYLSPGFEAIQGSIFRGYIENCTNNYGMRSSSDEDLPETVDEASIDNPYPQAMSGIGSSDLYKITQLPDYERLEIFPNPTSGKLTIRIEGISSQPQKIEIRNSLGTVIKTLDFNGSSEYDVDFDGQKAGIYLISIHFIEKVIIKRISKE